MVDAPKLTNSTYFESALFPPFFEIKCRKSTAQWDISQIFSENSSGDYYKNAFEFIKIRVWGPNLLKIKVFSVSSHRKNFFRFFVRKILKQAWKTSSKFCESFTACPSDICSFTNIYQITFADSLYSKYLNAHLLNNAVSIHYTFIYSILFQFWKEITKLFRFIFSCKKFVKQFDGLRRRKRNSFFGCMS